jgi:hypothetical protein
MIVNKGSAQAMAILHSGQIASTRAGFSVGTTGTVSPLICAREAHPLPFSRSYTWREFFEFLWQDRLCKVRPCPRQSTTAKSRIRCKKHRRRTSALSFCGPNLHPCLQGANRIHGLQQELILMRRCDDEQAAILRDDLFVDATRFSAAIVARSHGHIVHGKIAFEQI